MNDETKDPIAELIRAAGKRPHVDAERMARVRAAVHDEWTAQQVRKRRIRLFAAACFLAILGGTAIYRLLPARAVPVAVYETAALPASFDLDLGTLRLERGTRVTRAEGDALTLERGMIFVATSGATSLVVHTPFGDVRDIGTQFEVRLSPHDVQVRVREGLVELRGERASAGESLLATSSNVQKSRDANDWEWVERAAPPIRLEGATLADVLRRVAREKGLALDWHADPARRNVVLRGNEPFTPSEALDAATAAAGVRYRIEGNRLVIEEGR